MAKPKITRTNIQIKINQIQHYETAEDHGFEYWKAEGLFKKSAAKGYEPIWSVGSMLDDLD